MHAQILTSIVIKARFRQDHSGSLFKYLFRVTVLKIFSGISVVYISHWSHFIAEIEPVDDYLLLCFSSQSHDSRVGFNSLVRPFFTTNRALTTSTASKVLKPFRVHGTPNTNSKFPTQTDNFRFSSSKKRRFSSYFDSNAKILCELDRIIIAVNRLSPSIHIRRFTVGFIRFKCVLFWIDHLLDGISSLVTVAMVFARKFSSFFSQN